MQFAPGKDWVLNSERLMQKKGTKQLPGQDPRQAPACAQSFCVNAFGFTLLNTAMQSLNSAATVAFLAFASWLCSVPFPTTNQHVTSHEVSWIEVELLQVWTSKPAWRQKLGGYLLR